MKPILRFLGKAAFFVGWPVWYLHFRLRPHRSRVLVVCDGQVLLIRGWLGDGAWSLPGGGIKNGESITAASVRELKEEVGIDVPESSVRSLGSYRHKAGGISYQAECGVIELEEKPNLHLQWYEIADAKWFALSDVKGRMLGKDAAYALKQYLPLDQTRLL